METTAEIRVGIIGAIKVGITEETRVGTTEEIKVGITEETRVGITEAIKAGITVETRVEIIAGTNTRVIYGQCVSFFPSGNRPRRTFHIPLNPTKFSLSHTCSSWMSTNLSPGDHDGDQDDSQ